MWGCRYALQGGRKDSCCAPPPASLVPAHPQGPAASTASYLSIPAILQAIKQTGADAVHPGYGARRRAGQSWLAGAGGQAAMPCHFVMAEPTLARRHPAPAAHHPFIPPAGFLSENAAFVQAVEAAGATFVGPPTYAVEKMGDKVESKKFAQAAGVRKGCRCRWWSHASRGMVRRQPCSLHVEAGARWLNASCPACLLAGEHDPWVGGCDRERRPRAGCGPRHRLPRHDQGVCGGRRQGKGGRRHAGRTAHRPGAWLGGQGDARACCKSHRSAFLPQSRNVAVQGMRVAWTERELLEGYELCTQVG